MQVTNGILTFLSLIALLLMVNACSNIRKLNIVDAGAASGEIIEHSAMQQMSTVLAEYPTIDSAPNTLAYTK